MFIATCAHGKKKILCFFTFVCLVCVWLYVYSNSIVHMWRSEVYTLLPEGWQGSNSDQEARQQESLLWHLDDTNFICI